MFAHIQLGTNDCLALLHNVSSIHLLYMVPTHPGKWEIPWNFAIHVPSREMSLKIKKNGQNPGFTHEIIIESVIF